jgi:hypothetical protein
VWLKTIETDLDSSGSRRCVTAIWQWMAGDHMSMNGGSASTRCQVWWFFLFLFILTLSFTFFFFFFFFFFYRWFIAIVCGGKGNGWVVGGWLGRVLAITITKALEWNEGERWNDVEGLFTMWLRWGRNYSSSGSLLLLVMKELSMVRMVARLK